MPKNRLPPSKSDLMKAAVSLCLGLALAPVAMGQSTNPDAASVLPPKPPAAAIKPAASGQSAATAKANEVADSAKPAAPGHSVPGPNASKATKPPATVVLKAPKTDDPNKGLPRESLKQTVAELLDTDAKLALEAERAKLPAPPPSSVATVKKIAEPPPKDTVRVIEVYGPAGSKSATIEVNGAQRLVNDGAQWMGYKVSGIAAGCLTLSDNPAKTADNGRHCYREIPVASPSVDGSPTPTAGAPMPMPQPVIIPLPRPSAPASGTAAGAAPRH